MGNVIHKMTRPLRTFNIENRAHRVISRDKPKPAPKYKSTELELDRVYKENPNIVEEMSRKDKALDSRLKEVFVSSTDILPIDNINAKNNPDRPLPLDRKPTKDFEYGFKEPDVVADGFTTLRQSLEFINGYAQEPDKFTTHYIAAKYKLKHETVCNIIKYFKTFEVFVPDKKANVRFARPTGFRRLE